MQCYRISESLFARLLKDDVYLDVGKNNYFKLEEDDSGHAAVFLDEPSYIDYVNYCWQREEDLTALRLNRFPSPFKDSLFAYYVHNGWSWKTEDGKVLEFLKDKGYDIQA